MKNLKLDKIIYFDRETISNMLQVLNQGDKIMQNISSNASKGNLKINAGTEIETKFSVPFFTRVKFLFSANAIQEYIISKNQTVTINSTEVSEFNSKIKPSLKHFNNKKVDDIKNSSTFFRVAGAYLRIAREGVEGMNVTEFNDVLSGMEGYDTYKINDSQYVRFNNTAFVSNYKRQDLLYTHMDMYCIEVGEFLTEDFDFFKQLNEMHKLLPGVESSQILADIYPSKIIKYSDLDEDNLSLDIDNDNGVKTVKLYDVVYASVSTISDNRDE